MTKLTVNEISVLPEDVNRLIALSEKEGYRFVRKMAEQWISGENRFDQPGEVIYGAFDNSVLVGICGLNQDPYAEQIEVGRLRHLYVDYKYRNNGIARMLVSRCLENASHHFSSVRLRTPDERVNGFYSHMGFSEVDVATATHAICLVNGYSQPNTDPLLTDGNDGNKF